MENKSIVCSECGNNIDLDASRVYVVGDIIECSFCGTELEIVSISSEGTFEVEIVEEEK